MIALLRLAAAQWPYWYWGEALGWRHWLPDALDRCDTSSPARVEALIALASLLMRSGEDARRWEALFDEAHELAVSLASEQLVAQVNFYHAHAFLSRGERQSLRGALDGTGSQLGAMTGRLRRCRTQLIETLGPERWQRAERKTLNMPVEEAIIRALAALETLSCPDG